MVMQVKYESDTESHGLGPGPCLICGSIKWIPSCGSSPNKAANNLWRMVHHWILFWIEELVSFFAKWKQMKSNLKLVLGMLFRQSDLVWASRPISLQNCSRYIFLWVVLTPNFVPKILYFVSNLLCLC